MISEAERKRSGSGAEAERKRNGSGTEAERKRNGSKIGAFLFDVFSSQFYLDLSNEEIPLILTVSIKPIC